MMLFRVLLSVGGVLLITGVSWGGVLRVNLASERHLQPIDGFGAFVNDEAGRDPRAQQLFFEDLGGNIVRMDVTPRFAKPYSADHYYSPWFYRSASLLTFPPDLPANNDTAGGAEKNNVRTYTNATDYGRNFGGKSAPIAVMIPDIEKNIARFDLAEPGAITLYKAGKKWAKDPAEVKLIGAIWSPPPWVKISSGNRIGASSPVMPRAGTPWPFIWGGNFAGGKLDISGTPLAIFHDGTGPTSALTQFARAQAAYIKGLQDRHQVRFYALSVQNELGFEQFYSSCLYPTPEHFLVTLKALRAEFKKYPDLRDIIWMGPEDLLGGDAYGMWQYGGGANAQSKNLQYLRALAKDKEALEALGLLCIHGYSPDGVRAAGADPQSWQWWAHGWKDSPAPGIPANIRGFTSLKKKSWMTETSGEEHAWLAPTNGFPANGGFSIAVKIHQALTVGRQSAWVYWQFIEKDAGSNESLTGWKTQAGSPKYIAAKHFFRQVRPGAMAVPVEQTTPPGILASAYLHRQNRSLVLVVINTRTQPETVTLDLPVSRSMEAWQSDAAALWKTTPLRQSGRHREISLPPYSVTTIQLIH